MKLVVSIWRGTQRTLKNSHEIQINPSSILFQEKPEWVIYYKLVLATKEYMRNALE
ncbi:unnamed protein product (macronuclear) [Paramecium tetraurelia]|uniref:DEAD-box helicase OB fold domain-containing protein n=1 Tax=Paramecium tetraurelia TaxID=5888 RepID=A0E754_PARTE|nr:uncharacterized protein GSPATT00023849001 [Paramecium tetraurelia]CAK91121.1 unnamed protein product [Paramecium tetraurelia]|eukprot:XP_001458518.1 hypothetical protein (macronuclear) [Paramecium tetraurelia strain d4-2]